MVLHMVALSHIDLVAQNSVERCDKKLDAFIENYWQFDTNGLVALDTGKVLDFCLEKLPENKCLIGKNKEQIISLFGQPHEIVGSKLSYYTVKGCLEKPMLFCNYIRFYFDENGIYKYVGISGLSKSICR